MIENAQRFIDSFDLGLNATMLIKKSNRCSTAND